MNIVQLDEALKAVCPIQGVSIGRRDDMATWRIDFTDTATESEKDAARAVLASVVLPLEPLLPVQR